MDRKSWYSKAKILQIKYEDPILRMTSGVKKDNQGSYDNSPYLHGSNGTYVENSSKFFNLNFLVYRRTNKNIKRRIQEARRILHFKARYFVNTDTPSRFFNFNCYI